MPALRDGDFAISDSSAIVAYLEAKYPHPVLIPHRPEARARTIWFDEFGDTILMGCGREIFFNRVVAPRFLKIAGDQAAAERAEREGLPPILDYLERTIPDSLFLVEDRLTLADLAVASPFANLRHIGIGPDASTHPRTALYVDAMLARPSFAPWLARETAFLAQL
jgi:glutathione S-transferase